MAAATELALPVNAGGLYCDIWSVEREPCSRSSANTRCLGQCRLFQRVEQGMQDLLSGHPAPVLECLLTDTPSSREVTKLAHVHTVMR